MFLHANAIAENRAARIRAGRVDSNDSYGVTIFSKMPRHVIDERALAGTWRAGKADHAGFAGVREQSLEQIGPTGRTVFDDGDGAGEGAGIAGA